MMPCWNVYVCYRVESSLVDGGVELLVFILRMRERALFVDLLLTVQEERTV